MGFGTSSKDRLWIEVWVLLRHKFCKKNCWPCNGTQTGQIEKGSQVSEELTEDFHLGDLFK